MYIATVFGE